MSQLRNGLLGFVSSFGIFVAGMLIAVQLRYDLRYGKALTEKYDAQPLTLYLLMGACLLGIYGFSWVLPLTRPVSYQRLFMVLVAALGVAAAAIWITLPDISQLQVLYFVITSILLSLIVVIFVGYLQAKRSFSSFIDDLQQLWNSRALIMVWLRYDIEVRYSQTVLGIVWILLRPLATSAVLALAFSKFLHVNFQVPFIAFFLSAIIVFHIFNDGVIKGTQSVIGSMNIIKQVAFPREIVVLMDMGEILIDFAFTFVAMLFINALVGIYPSWLYIYLIPIVIIMSSLTMGLMFLVSYLSVFVRDIPQLVAVLMRLLFYFTPVIYPAERIPENYQWMILVNPLAPLVQGSRDIIVYGNAPDLLSLSYPLIVSIVLLYVGYSFFKASEGYLADMV